eukprot:TRINITY_DN1516_c0_g1_i1.p1 TRINITY_DN1516_c0_g1~~TRINITY_DN1516_c0_g1_i1.p1  ORF type:complete len:302 (+),score=79.01 TRINITY_DN1516_c0_g1_i1:871-1776(+)
MSTTYKQNVCAYLESKTVSDIPVKSLITISGEMNLANAFQVLLEKDVQSAPVHVNGEYVGFLDIRDLVSYVIMLYNNESVANDTTLHDVISSGLAGVTTEEFAKKNIFVPVTMSDNLLTVAQILSRREVHRVPVVEDGVLVNIISQLDVIKMFSAQNFEDTTIVSQVPELGNPAITVETSRSLIDTFNVLFEKNITGVPLVDENGRLVATSSGKDLILFLRNPSLNLLSRSVFENLKAVRADDVGDEMAVTVTISINDTINRAIHLLAATGVHRLFVVDNEQTYKPLKAISFTDILNYLVN